MRSSVSHSTPELVFSSVHFIGNDVRSSGLIHGSDFPRIKNTLEERLALPGPCELPALRHSLSLRQALFLRVDEAVKFCQ